MNVEQELRQRREYTAEVGAYEPEGKSLEHIPYVIPGLTDKLKIKRKAEIASAEVLTETGDEYVANLELRNKLIYWSVVFGLSLDDKAAYKRHGQEYIENFIEYGLSKYFKVYENLGLEILTMSGLDDLIPDMDEEETESDIIA